MSDKGAALRQLCHCLCGRPPSDPDWDAIVTLASHSLTIPALKIFSDRFPALVPDDAKSYINTMYTSNLRRNEKLVEQIAEAAAVLNEAGIQPTLLKGAARLVQKTGEHLGTRITWDLDILVAPDEAERSFAALKQFGYTVRALAPSSSSHWHSTLIRVNEAACIDLHVRPPGYQYFPEAYRLDSEIMKCGGALVAVPRPIAQALILIIHDQLHDADYLLGRISLRHLVDLRELVHSPAGIDWGQLEAHFSTPFLKRAFDTQLVSLWSLLDVDIPGTIRRRAIPRFQHWRRMQQLSRPSTRNLLLAVTLAIDWPIYLAHRFRPHDRITNDHGASSSTKGQTSRSRFHFLRELSEKERLGKVQ